MCFKIGKLKKKLFCYIDMLLMKQDKAVQILFCQLNQRVLLFPI